MNLKDGIISLWQSSWQAPLDETTYWDEMQTPLTWQSSLQGPVDETTFLNDIVSTQIPLTPWDPYWKQDYDKSYRLNFKYSDYKKPISPIRSLIPTKDKIDQKKPEPTQWTWFLFTTLLIIFFIVLFIWFIPPKENFRTHYYTKYNGD